MTNWKRVFRTKEGGGKGDLPRPHSPKAFRENFDLINWHLTEQIATIKRVVGKSPAQSKTHD
jgi:hypothetical protein